ncbi:hypothetical protein [Desulfoscipio geothermicus]|uniref:Uncharacterized protein n=1 Tax=Desulfoscipio geothermicus DSM 3669 TaxID=1121426 RepID=A0A1I6DAN3_9FIRM|nr:hypothetical protein [Desulfoscipio geothermicus]SFR02489.1 hypothetical protein SAMN05660706_10812 [Desulfoscipio geothermicus DSM 3669]
MRFLISRNSICYFGKVSELRQLMQSWSRSTVTLHEYIIAGQTLTYLN